METTGELTLRKRVLNQVRYFNRRYFNPFSLSFAGRPYSFWSVILHTGRSSGKEYMTPIVADRQDGCFVIPLPYGRQVDWLKNIMAAARCELIYHGKVYRASQPEVISLEEGIGAFPGITQTLLRQSDTDAFLRLYEFSEAPDSEDRYRAFVATYPSERGLWVLATAGALAIGIARMVRRRKR